MKTILMLLVVSGFVSAAEGGNWPKPDEWTDADGKKYRVAGHNPKGSEVMTIDGKQYGKVTAEWEPDIIIDNEPYCEIGKPRKRKQTQTCGEN